MVNVGTRIQNMPAKYKGYLENNMVLGERALGASIFMLNQRDLEFRKAWTATESLPAPPPVVAQEQDRPVAQQ